MKSKSFDSRVAARTSKLPIISNGKSPLSTEELIKRAKGCQQAAKQSFIEWGEYLTILRDEERWDRTHDSFPAFCLEHFGISRSYAFDLMDSIPVWKSLSETCKKEVTNEWQIRELKKAPEVIRNEVVKTAKTYGPLTASNIRQSIKEVAHHNGIDMSAIADTQPLRTNSKPTISKPIGELAKKPEPKRDWEKNIIPPEALPFWERRNDFWSENKQLEALIKKVEEKLKPGDLIRSKLPHDVLEPLRQVLSDLKLTEFYCICPKCYGEPSTLTDGCVDCGHTGVISKVEFDKLHPCPTHS